MATNNVSSTLKPLDSSKSKKIARDVEDMRKLNNIYETQFRKAGLPEEPYVMSLEDRYDTFSRYGSRSHVSVRNTPFAPEEGYLQYQSFFYRDFYAMDDCILRLQNPQDEVFLKRMGVKPATVQPTSATEVPKQPQKERKKISLKDYQARSKAGALVSTPVVPQADVADLKKEALKNASVEKDQPAAEVEPKMSTNDVESTPPPKIKLDATENISPALGAPKIEKALESVEQVTSDHAIGTKRKHEELSSDAHVKSGISSLPHSKKPRPSERPAVSADLAPSSIGHSKAEPVTPEIVISEVTSSAVNTSSAIKQSPASQISSQRPAAHLTSQFPNPMGKKRRHNPSSSPPRFNSDGSDTTPSSPDTIGPRNVSTTNSSQSSAHSHHSALWSSDSDHAQITPSKPKPKHAQAGVARPVQTDSSVSAKPKLYASTEPLKPKVGTGIAKKVTKVKKDVSTSSAAFMQSILSSPMLTGVRPIAAGSAPRMKPASADPQAIASDAVNKADNTLFKLKYSKKVGQRVQKLFGPPAVSTAKAKPSEEDIARLQRLASHLRREIGKQRAFGADGLADVLGKAVMGIEANLKDR